MLWELCTGILQHEGKTMGYGHCDLLELVNFFQKANQLITKDSMHDI